MNIAVIAANGRSGKAFIKQALAAGHNIRGGIHGPSDLVPSDNLTILPCDATKSEDLKRLIDGQDAVVSLIGHVKGSPARVQTEAMHTLIAVMGACGLKRVISLTGTGVRFPSDKITLTDRILNLSISVIDPNRVNDGVEHVAVLNKSELDWTVIRVLKLQNVASRPFTLRLNGPTKPYVGRDEVAKAILDVLEQNLFVGQAPIIAKK
jgi:putative NADH-flavin reductase